MMNAGNLKGKTRQMDSWRRRLLAFVLTLSMLISSCGLTAFADPDGDIYSDPVAVPASESETTPETGEGDPAGAPAPEGQTETGTQPEEGTGEETGTEPGEGSGDETGTEPEAGSETGTEAGTDPEGASGAETEPEDLTVYEPGTLIAEAEGVQVTLDYTADAHVPEGTVLTLTRASGGELYAAMKAAAKILKENEDEVWQREIGDEAVFYTTLLTSPDGHKLDPRTGLTLTCTNLTIPAGSTGFVTGTEAANIDWDESVTVGFLPTAIGYASLNQTQIGNITLTHEGSDYTVTAVYGPDASFPKGTELKVREIMPGTPEYALYSGMTDEALNEDWSEITLERYFDITFVHEEEELEPQGYVDVQIIFSEKIEQNEETEVQAVHIENNEATVIESDTDSTEAAVQDDEAIDTVTFTSDSFSVYGVVQKKKIITKLLEAGGQTYEIGVTYTQEAEIPENAQIKVDEIEEGSDLWEAYRKQTAAALNADDVRLPGLYDISIIDEEGNKVEPKAPVNVAIKLANAEDTEEELHVVHFTEEIPPELVAPQPEEQTEVQTEPLPEEDKIESEKITATVEGDTVTFETESFSVYAFAYTVDFYFGVDGEVVEFHIPGGTVLGLRELLPILKIVEDDPSTEKDEIIAFINYIESVTFTDESLVHVARVSEDITAGNLIDSLGVQIEYSGDLTEENIAEIRSKLLSAPDWALISLKPFLSEEQLTITLKNGEIVIIRVTDAQDPSVFNGKQVIIYDNGEKRAMTANWEKNDWRTEFKSIAEDQADSDPKARWTIEGSNGNYYLKAYNGNYLKLDNTNVYLVSSKDEATPLTIQAGSNPDYRIYPQGRYDDCLTYCDNSQYNGFFSAQVGANNGSRQNWLYIREASSLTKQFSVDVDTTISGGARWGRLNSKYFGTENDRGKDGDRYPQSGTTAGKLGDDGITYFNFGFNGVPNDGYQFAFWAYQENGVYHQVDSITNTSIIPLNPTNYYAFFAPKGKKLFIYQTNDANKGTPNRPYGFSIEEMGALANPVYGNTFVGWFDENGSCVSFDQYFDPMTAKRSMILTAKFRQNGSVNVNVSVNDLNGGDLYSTDGSLYNNGAQSQNHTTGNDGSLQQSFTAVPKNGYTFAYWALNGKQMGYYSDTIGPGKVFFSANDQLQAVFKKVEQTIDATDGVQSDIVLSDERKRELEKLLSTLGNSDVVTGEKTAHSVDYANRIYEIDFNTESALMDLAANVDIAFIIDVSNSMLFPAKLVRTDKTMVLTQANLNAAFPDGGTYYIISDPTSTSTVYRIFRDSDGFWNAVDASYDDNQSFRIEWNAKYADLSLPVPNAYPIYRSAENKQRKDYLQESITNSIDSLIGVLDNLDAAGASTSKINIAWNTFAHSLKYSSNGFTQLDSTFKIDIGQTEGGTHQDLGLNDAAEFNWTGTNQKYAILITDGAPNDSNDPDIFQHVREAAQNLQKKGVKLITVGLSTMNVSEGSQLLKDIADTYPNTNNKLFFQAESGSDLENILMEALMLIMSKQTVSGEITDVIDPAFYPVNDNGMPLEAGYYNLDGTPFSGDGVKSGYERYLLEYDSSLSAWKITYKNLLFTPDPRVFSIKVKAKEDFLGGNKINTNVGDAEINPIWWRNTTGGPEWPTFNRDKVKIIKLPSPMVNVDELSFTNGWSEETVNLGANVIPKDKLQLLLNSIAVKEVVSASNTDHRRTAASLKITDDGFSPETYDLNTIVSAISNLTDEYWSTLSNSGSVEFPYSAYGHYNVGRIKLSVIQTAVEGVTPNIYDHATTAAGNHVETYTVSAEYIPGSTGAATTYAHTTANHSAGDLTGKIASENPHYVNVVTSSIEAEKVWDNSYEPATTDKVVFRLYKSSVAPNFDQMSSGEPQTTGEDGEGTSEGSGENTDEGTSEVPGEGIGEDSGGSPGEGTEDKQRISVSVSQWYNGINPWNVYGEATSASSGEITIQIYTRSHQNPGDGDSPVGTLVLSPSNGWRNSVLLPYVSEVNEGGYVLVFSSNGISSAFIGHSLRYEVLDDNDCSVQLTGYYINSSGIIETFFEALSNSACADETTVFEPTASNKLVRPADAELIRAVELDGREDSSGEYSAWKTHWTDLPQLDENNNPIYYYVEEASSTVKSTATYTYTRDVSGVRVVKVRIKNTPDAPDVGDLNVSKTVTGNAGSPTQDFTFTVTLTGHTGEETFNTVKVSNGTSTNGTLPFIDGIGSFTLKHNENLTIKDLPEGTQYNVSETSVAEYTTTTTGNTSGTIPANDTAYAGFINDKTDIYGHLTVNKILAGKYDPNLLPVKYQIGVKDASGNYYTGNGQSNGQEPVYQEVVAGIDHTAVWSNLPPQRYTIVEANGNYNGFVVTPTGLGEIDIAAGQNPNINVTNTFHYPVNVHARKAWNAGEPTLTKAVQFTLMRQAEAQGQPLKVEEEGVVNPVIVSAANNWEYTWNDLDKYSDDMGHQYSYFVVETGVYYGNKGVSQIEDGDWTDATITYGDGSSVGFDGAGNGSVIIKNYEKINVPVTKTWDAYNDSKYTWTVGFQLQQKEVLVNGDGDSNAISEWTNVEGKTLTLSKNNMTSTQFTDLDLFRVHDNGSVYRILYRAEEVSYEVSKTEGETTTTVARWDKNNATLLVSDNGIDYEPIYTQNAGEDMSIPDLLARYSIVVENRPKVNYDGMLVIHKEWLDIYPEDLQHYPDVFVDLYKIPDDQYDNSIHMGTYSRASLYDPDPNNGFTHHRLSYADNWTWVIEGLPTTNRYFVVESNYNLNNANYNRTEGKIRTGLVIETYPEYPSSQDPAMGITVEEYKARDKYGEGTWRTGNWQEAVLAYTGNTGEILIQNNAPSKYMQMDLKKKFLEYRDDGNGVYSLWTTTAEYDTMKNMIIEIQIMRRMVEETTDGDKPLDDGRWKPYGNTIFVGYDAAGKAYINPNNNLFQVINGDGTWHFRIPSNNQHEGLPRRGYQIVDGQLKLVRYQYILKEVQVYNGSLVKIGDDWAAWLPWLWDGITDTPTQREVNVPATAQDQDRLFNTPGAKLYIEKEWNIPATDVDIKEIYVQVFRRLKNGTGSTENYIEFMLEHSSVGLGQDYLEGNPAGTLDETNKWLVLSPSNDWSAVLHKVQISTFDTNKGEYEYYLVEAGYKDSNDVVHTAEQADSDFHPVYSRKVDETGTWEDMGTGLVLQWKHKNYLKIKNTIDIVSIPVEKDWTGGTPDANAAIDVELVKVVNGTEVPFNPVKKLTLKADTDPAKNWKGVFANLARQDDEGNPITYRIKETRVVLDGKEYTGENLTTVFGLESFEIASNSITAETKATITNPIEKKHISAKKQWNGVETWPENMSVTFTLFSKTGADGSWNETAETTDQRYGSNTPSVTVTSADTEKTVSWTNLPKWDFDNGTIKEIFYKVEETFVKYNDKELVTPFGTVYDVETLPVDANGLVIINNKTRITERHAEKIWEDHDNAKNLRPVSIIFTLQAKDDQNNDVDLSQYNITGAVSQTVTADASQNGKMHADWTGLPVYTREGKPITYTCVETAVANYTQVGEAVYNDTTFTWTFKNKLNEINLKIIKDDSTDETKKLSGAVFELRRKTGEQYVPVTDGSITNVNSEGRFTVNESIELTGITDGEYQIAEISAPAGYIAFNGVINFTVQNGTIVQPNVDGTIIRYNEAITGANPAPAEFKVANTPGTALPATGGSGTLIYTIAGMILMVLAGVLLVSRKRKTNR